MPGMNAVKLQSKSKVSCCVVGCHNSYVNTGARREKISFYSFLAASKVYLREKREMWIKAVRRKNEHGTIWTPSKDMRICSTHFVGGCKSEDPSSPSYIPSKFPDIYGKGKVLTADRYERQKSRKRSAGVLQNSARARQRVEVEETVVMSGVVTEVNVLHDDPMPAPTFSDAVNESREFTPDSDIPKFSVECYVNMDSQGPETIDYLLCKIVREENGVLNAETQVHLKERKKVFIPKGPRASVSVPTKVKQGSQSFHGLQSVKTGRQMQELVGVTFAVFTILYNLLSDVHGCKLNKANKLLLFLVKLKTGVSYSVVGHLFRVHRTTAPRIFLCVLKVLATKMRNYIFWPSKHAVCSSLPESFRELPPNFRAIIGCSEIRIAIPRLVKHRNLCYSHYKGTYTLKFLLACTPNAFVSFISDCYGGRTSDSFIVNDCGFLSLLENGDVILVDKGFPNIKTGSDAVVITPPFLRTPQFSVSEVQETLKIASARVHVEKCIQRLKTFNILTNKIPTILFLYVDNIVFVCSALLNLQRPITKADF